jgi:hypothetical protein
VNPQHLRTDKITPIALQTIGVAEFEVSFIDANTRVGVSPRRAGWLILGVSCRLTKPHSPAPVFIGGPPSSQTANTYVIPRSLKERHVGHDHKTILRDVALFKCLSEDTPRFSVRIAIRRIEYADVVVPGSVG